MALSRSFLNRKVGNLPTVNFVLGTVGLAAATKVYDNSIVARATQGINAGYRVPASADPTLVVEGRCASGADNTSGANGDVNVEIECGVYDWDMATGVNALTIADLGRVVYAQDDHTVSRTDQGGTLPAAGILLGLETYANVSTARALVLMGASFMAAVLSSAGAGVRDYARAVITSLAAFTAANGTLTANAFGAIGAQDVVTLVAGDVVLLPAYQGGAGANTAANAGPYVVAAVGTAGTPFVLTRPAWWPQGGVIPVNRSIRIGGEGTKWGGSEWRPFCAGSLVIGTGDPLLYPRVDKGVGAVGTQVTHVFGRTAAAYSAVDNTGAHAVATAFVAGNGSGTLDFTGTATDAIDYMVINN